MKSAISRWLDSDIGYSFRSSPVAVGAALVALLCVLGGGDVQGMPSAFYFHKEDLVLRIVQKQPLLVWVGFREMVIYENED